MTWWFVLMWSGIRTVAVATLAVGIGHGLWRQARQCRSLTVRLLWLTALLSPLLMPDLIVGFTYRLTAQRLTELPAGVQVWVTELLYFALLLVRSGAVSVLVFLLLPQSSVTRESLHSWQLLEGRGRRAAWNQWTLLLTGPWRSRGVAWCLTALVSFQDFETAALIQVDQHPVVWTVWLFDAIAGNQLLSESLRHVVAPVLFELMLLGPGLWLITRPSGGAAASSDLPRGSHVGRSPQLLAAVLTVIGVCCVFGRPLMVSLPELPGGLTVLSGDVPGVLQQQLSTFLFSATAAVLAVVVAVVLRRRNHPLWICCCLLPGLAGPLVLSLVLLWLFQQPGFILLWDSWLPLLLGQSLLLLPRAWVLLLILESTTTPETIHSARLLLTGSGPLQSSGGRILWRLVHLRWVAVTAVLCHWCTWDVTTASILRPVTVEPVVTRLYQEMHFSRTESLTALSIVTMAFPFIVAVVALSALRLLSGRSRGQD